MFYGQRKHKINDMKSVWINKGSLFDKLTVCLTGQ